MKLPTPYYEDKDAACQSPLSWHGLYSGQTALLTPGSFAHPAKMAPALCFRIFDHLTELGLLKPEDTVLDPMAGTGLTGLAWAAKGGRSVLVEMEGRFVGFINDNKAQLARTLGREVEIEVIQGDARHLSELLGERGLKAVTSPPYIQSEGRGNNPVGGALEMPDGYWDKAGGIGHTKVGAYGTTPGQIGALPDKPLKAVTSPPYSDSNIAREDTWQNGNGFGGPHSQVRAQHYGTTPGQIGQERQESYLSAMRQVYAEIAKVADVLVVVTKNPTRAGKLRRLDLDTIALLEETGWTVRCHHHAILFEEQEQGHLFDGSKKHTRGRLSFFKRLSWQKGNAVAQWEDVLVATRR